MAVSVTIRRGRLARSAVATLPSALKELDFQRQLVGTKPPGLAVILGWEHVHFRPGMTKHGWRTAGTGSLAAGWPDLTLVRPRDRRLIFAELKADGAVTSPDQERVLGVLRSLEVGHDRPLLDDISVEVHVWRPRDWDRIEATLR